MPATSAGMTLASGRARTDARLWASVYPWLLLLPAAVLLAAFTHYPILATV
jgi:sn-glycerol 3-phosphate transport system permease protein